MNDIKEIIDIVLVLLFSISSFVLGIFIRVYNKKSKTNDKEEIIKLKRISRYIMLFGGGVGLVAVYKIIDMLRQNGIISIADNSIVWKISKLSCIILIGTIFVFVGRILEGRIVKGKDDADVMHIKATVVGEDKTFGRKTFPGYNGLVLSYKDPYSGKECNYTLKNDVRVKKYLKGSEYMLLYSRQKHQAYDIKSNDTERSVALGAYFVAGVAFTAVVAYVIMWVISK